MWLRTTDRGNAVGIYVVDATGSVCNRVATATLHADDVCNRVVTATLSAPAGFGLRIQARALASDHRSHFLYLVIAESD